MSLNPATLRGFQCEQTDLRRISFFVSPWIGNHLLAIHPYMADRLYTFLPEQTLKITNFYFHISEKWKMPSGIL